MFSRNQHRKGEIIFALHIHNTVGIDAIQTEVRNTNAMLTKLIDIVDHSTEKNEELNRTMNDLGGRSRVLGDDQLLTTMTVAIQSRSSSSLKIPKSPPSTPGIPSITVTSASNAAVEVKEGDKLAGKEDAVLSASERHELRLPLDSLLNQNLGFYTQKLDAQVTLITSQLDKLASSSAVILKTITGGIWERILHPDLREIWKENAWKTNVEARLFVLAIHDYYIDLFARRAWRIDKPTSPPTETEVSSSFAPASDADKWCLHYLTVRYSSALMEVFDADGSGFVRVTEVNDFCSAIPKGLSLLQWLAYWTAGMLIS